MGIVITVVLILAMAVVAGTVIMKMEHILSNDLFDALALSIKILGYFQVFWLSLGQCWGLPYITEIGSTIAAVMVLIESILTTSKRNYKNSEELGLQDIENNKIKGNIQFEEERDYEQKL